MVHGVDPALHPDLLGAVLLALETLDLDDEVLVRPRTVVGAPLRRVAGAALRPGQLHEEVRRVRMRSLGALRTAGGSIRPTPVRLTIATSGV